MSDETLKTGRHQADRENLKYLLIPLAVVAAILLAGHLVLRAMVHAHPQPRPIEVAADGRPGQPQAGDFATLRQRKRARLERFGWVDEDGSIAHIPIEQAIHIIAREHERGPAGDERQGAESVQTDTDGGDL